jgi:putative FmdB family regulatory protein
VPLYAFRCPDCATAFDERRPFARADDPATCPGCGGTGASKQFGSPMVFQRGAAGRAILAEAGTRAARAATTSSGHAGGCPCCSGGRPAAPTPAAPATDAAR